LTDHRKVWANCHNGKETLIFTLDFGRHTQYDGPIYMLGYGSQSVWIQIRILERALAVCSQLCRLRVVAKSARSENPNLRVHLWDALRFSLDRPIFKRKKVFANLRLGLNYCSMGSSWLPSRDTVPLSGKHWWAYHS
jgi:hypothetical protein